MQKRSDRLRTDRERTETAGRPEIAGPEHHYFLLNFEKMELNYILAFFNYIFGDNFGDNFQYKCTGKQL